MFGSSKRLEGKINELSVTLYRARNEIEEKLKQLELEIEKLKIHLGELEHKYNSIRASVAARSKTSGELELIKRLAKAKRFDLLEELGYKVIPVPSEGEMQERNNNNK